MEFGIGSGFRRKERSGSDEDEWRALKMGKLEDFSASETMPPHQSNQVAPRSDALFSPDQYSRNQELMLSFSAPKPEISCKDGAFPCYQPRNAGYGGGYGYFGGIRGPFSPSQWSELQHQALIYKYITANVPVPSNLLIPVKRSFNAYGLSYPSNSFGWGSFHLGFSGNADPEPGRCRRTDGKKWRCSRDAVADQKYCERHINRGRHRSRKPVEGQTGHAASGTTAVSSKAAAAPPPMMNPPFPLPASVMPGGSAIHQPVNRMQETHRLYMKPEEPNNNPFQESPELEFGLVSSDSLLNPSKNMGGSPFMDFSDQETRDQHPIRQFMDEWPKDPTSSCPAMAWPEELKPDRTQLSMSMSDFSSGGPLGEVLGSCSPRLGSSPTGVLQKVALGSFSNSSSGGSPRAENRSVHDRMSYFDDVLGSSLASSSIPSL